MLKVELLIDVDTAPDGSKAVERVMDALEPFYYQIKSTPNYIGPKLFDDPQEPPPVAAPPAPAPSIMTMVYTDGGCDTKRNGVGAWAFLAHTPAGEAIQRVEGMMQTTNNRMELLAVIKALEILEIGPPIRVASDSKYVIEGATKWHKNWRRNGWLTADGKQVKNRDLWEALIPLVQVHDVSFVHVKAHSGHPQNEHVDALCTSELNKVYDLALKGQDVMTDLGGSYATSA